MLPNINTAVQYEIPINLQEQPTIVVIEPSVWGCFGLQWQRVGLVDPHQYRVPLTFPMKNKNELYQVIVFTAYCKYHAARSI